MDRTTTTLRDRGIRWLCVAGFAGAIPQLDVEALREPRSLPSGMRLVKNSTTRSVVRLEDPQESDGPGLYVKRDKFRDWTDSLRYALVASKPQQEWKVCRALQRAGIPTGDVLAMGHRRRGPFPVEGFVVSREIPDTVELRDVLLGAEALPAGVLQELAVLTARFVDAGFWHKDYHVGNLLLRHDGAPGERLFIMDLHSVRCRRPGRRRVRQMLTMLAHSVRDRGISHAEQDQFLRRFLAAWEHGPGESALDDWRDALGGSKRRFRRRHVKSRMKRCLKESSLFTADRTDRFIVHHRRDFPLQEALNAIQSHRSALDGERAGAEVYRRAGRTELSLVDAAAVPPCGDGQPAPEQQVRPGRVCVKAFCRDSALARLKDRLRWRSRARTAWVAHRGFSVLGVPAPRPLALLEAGGMLPGGPDYLVTEAIPNDGDLWEYTSTRHLGREARDVLGRTVAELLRLLAREEVYHRDTKPTNFLVRECDGGYRLWLVDLDRARFNRPLQRVEWVKCLARLNAGLPGNITLLDRMRVLRRCGRDRWTAKERLEIAKAVLEQSRRRSIKWHHRPE